MQYWEDSDRRHAPQGLGTWRTWSMVKWLIVINIVVYLLQFTLALTSPRLAGGFVLSFGLYVPRAIYGGYLWQLVTYAFLHAGIFHILLNMLFLYWFGSAVEQAWGARRFLLFYLGAAAFAGMCYAGLEMAFAEDLSRDARLCIGASGAVMALMMVYAIYWPNRIILFMFFFPMRMRTFVILTVVIETMTLLEMNQNNQTATMAHLGGLLYGFMAVYLWPLLQGRLASRHDDRLELSDASDQQRLDRLLDKVHRDGVNSLSWGERRFLRKFAKKR